MLGRASMDDARKQMMAMGRFRTSQSFGQETRQRKRDSGDETLTYLHIRKNIEKILRREISCEMVKRHFD